MKTVYRLRHTTISTGGEKQPRTLWIGSTEPSSNDVRNAINQIEHLQERDAFYQSKNDYILVQK